MVSLGQSASELRKKMAEKDPFTTFLIAAAVAGISIGGTWVLSGQGQDREAVRQLATLSTKVETLTSEMQRLNTGLSTVLVLSVRIDNAERVIDKQQEALEYLRMNRVPPSQR